MRLVLRSFLIESTSLGCDDRHWKFREYLSANATNDPRLQEMLDGNPNSEYHRRLAYWQIMGRRGPPPWEGLTWVLDLLPEHPEKAVDAISAYIVAHGQILPDGRFSGLGDAADLIRIRFIGVPTTEDEAVELIRALDWDRFEALVARLYAAMGYSTRLTRAGADGGYDIEATRSGPGKQERILVDCKRHNKPVGVTPVRGMLGLVIEHRANKGVLVASSGFTRPARVFSASDARIELLNAKALVPLLNQHLGAKWPERLESLIAEGFRSRAA